jgi:phosphoserine aminotransferase
VTTGTVDAIVIPPELLPSDGRFGSGPGKVRQAQADHLAALGTTWLGTSHRQAPVKDVVRRIRAGLADLLGAPAGYEVVLGNGGATAFWDVAVLGLIEQRSQHVVLGEFSAKCAAAAARAPFLAEPSRVAVPPGQLITAHAEAGVDAYAWPHNETSTGVMSPVRRVAGADGGALMLVDATSAAGGLPVDLTQCDAYYFAPQKCLAADGGLWLAVLSPAAIERAQRIAASGRWIPEFLSLTTAIENSRQDQTLNTPALATLSLLVDQVEWLLGSGGLAWACERTATSAATLYGWAERSDCAGPFVADPAARSSVIATIDFDPTVDAAGLAKALRRNGIVDVEPYRKLGRNQLRIAMFPAIDPDDVTAMTACIDYLTARLA